MAKKRRNNNPYGQRGFGYRGNRNLRAGMSPMGGCLVLLWVIPLLIVISALTH
jgi:hypothetical protein